MHKLIQIYSWYKNDLFICVKKCENCQIHDLVYQLQNAHFSMSHIEQVCKMLWDNSKIHILISKLYMNTHTSLQHTKKSYFVYIVHNIVVRDVNLELHILIVSKQICIKDKFRVLDIFVFFPAD